MPLWDQLKETGSVEYFASSIQSSFSVIELYSAEFVRRRRRRSGKRKPLESICDEEVEYPSSPRTVCFGSRGKSVAVAVQVAAQRTSQTLLNEICKCLLEEAKRKCSISRRTKRSATSSGGEEAYIYIISEENVKRKPHKISCICTRLCCVSCIFF